MKPLPLLLLVAALTPALAACGSGTPGDRDSATSLPPPANAQERFKELAGLHEKASFHLIYDLDRHVGDDRGQFSWMQSGEQIRWDEVWTRDGNLFGTSFLQSNGLDLACDWLVKQGATAADLACSRTLGLDGESTYILLEEFFSAPSIVSFDRYQTWLGVLAECYRFGPGPFGVVCLTSDGIPLSVHATSESSPGRGITYSLAALEIRPLPTDADLHAPLAAGIVPDAPYRTLPLDEVTLPSIPLVEEFLRRTPDRAQSSATP